MSETNGIKVSTPEGIVDTTISMPEVEIETEIPVEVVDVEPIEVEEPKPYEFRKLGMPDVFLMFKIIGAIGINEFSACFGKEGVVNVLKSLSAEEKEQKSGEMAAAVALALEIGHVILNNIGKCEHEVYQLLAQTSNLTIEEITAPGNAVMGLEMIIDFVQKDEFPDFIKVVSKLFK